MPIEIGLTMNYHFSTDNIERAYLDHTYFDFLSEYDVLCRPVFPVENPQKLEQYLDTISGLIFTGGLDLNLEHWNKPLHPQAVIVHKRRQAFELCLLQAAINRQMPILGICLGMQLINVALGGELNQHIPDACGIVDHGYNGKKTRHNVTLHPESRLRQWLGSDSIEVASAHHQGVTRPGRNLLAAAIADDGVIEAVEMMDYPYLMAVQWHPEKEPDLPINRKIISSFIESSEAFQFDRKKKE